MRIYAEYKGEEFELVVGQEYEFSDTIDFCEKTTKKGRFSYISGQNFFCYANCIKKAWFKYIRPIQKPKPRQLTHKEIAVKLVGKGVFKKKEVGGFWFYGWNQWSTIEISNFCFFTDLDTDHEKWHKLTTDLLDVLNIKGA